MATTDADRESLQVKLAALVATAGLLTVGSVAVMARLVDRPFRYFSKEPAETFGAPLYVGYLASAAWVVWVVGATCALLAAAVAHRQGDGPETTRFLLAGGLITAAMAVDDVFLFHDGVLPKIGIPEEAVYLGYAVAFVWFTWRFRRQVLVTAAAPLVLAGVFFGISVMGDFIQETWDRHLHFVEDGGKFVGVCLWTAFLTRAAYTALTHRAAVDAAVDATA